MKTKIYDFLKRNWVWLLSPLIVGGFFLVFFLIKDVEPFGDHSLVNYDCYNQYYPFLCTLYDKLKGGEGLQYYWNSGLGANFLLNYFSHLSSPLNLLVIFVKRNQISAFISFLIALKISFSAATFSFFLSRKNSLIRKSNVINIALSVAYALSNFATCYSHEIMWLDALILLPIIILGFESLINDKKPYIYILSLSLCAFCNSYPTYFIALFLIILFFMHDHKSIKDFFVNGFIFAGSSILAAGMSAITMCVSLTYMSYSYASEDSFAKHFWYGNIFEVIRYQFVFSKPTTISYNYNHANIYCGIVAIVLFFVYLFISEINIFTRIKKAALLLLLLVSMNENVLNYIWHGFHFQTGVPNRFSFLYIFLLLDISYECFCSMSMKDTKRIIVGVFIAELFPMVCYFFVDFDSFIVSKNILIISLVGVMIYGILIIVPIVMKKTSKTVNLLCAFVIIIEIFANAAYVFSYSIIPLKSVTVANSIHDVVEEHCDSEFERAELFGNSPNLNSVIGLNGVAIFSSSYSYENYMNLFNLGLSVSSNSIRFLSTVAPMDDLLGIKYIIDTDNKLTYGDRTSFSKIYDDNGITVYENANAFPMIFSVNKDIENYESDSIGNIFHTYNSLANSMYGLKELTADVIPDYKVFSDNCELLYGNSDYLGFQYKTDNPEKREIHIQFDIPEDGDYSCYFGNDGNRCNLSVSVNSSVIESKDLDVCIPIYLGKRKKDDNVEIIIRGVENSTEYLEQGNTGICGLYVARLNDSIEDEFAKSAKNNAFTFNETKDDYFEGSINLSDSQVVFSSIPYDDGWHIYEDGKEIQKKNYAGFIGLDIGKGTHSLKFYYKTKGLNTGIIISIVSWLSFVLMCIILNKRTNNENIEDEK